MQQIPVEKRVVDYAIVNENHNEECMARVKTYLNDGWVLHGDLKVLFNETHQTYHYIQAMAKIEIRPVPGFEPSNIARPMPGSNLILG